ncbi:MAG: flavin reductase family protein [Dehalococcoidia bacterium]|nr:flavin reductase family protein [Dehalococcoidia bacterium]MCA9851043.1 flavin reductase family protein [Dehalococcoidia bacterium]MCA9857288.1 flavin reductase family protein [Dehalococcoidia bacterium]MCB9484456.1 flavin reductase family protein [Dehalococcoidia bacterium]
MADDPFQNLPPEDSELRPNAEAGRLLLGGPVALLTTTYRGVPNVMPLSWFMPVSADPPLVAISVGQGRHTAEMVAHSQEFALNFPKRPYLHHVQYLGSLKGEEVDKFEATQWETFVPVRITAPLLMNCAGWIECQVVETLPFGDHVLFLGEVVAVRVDPDSYDGERKRWRLDAENEDDRPLHFLGANEYSALSRVYEARMPRDFEAPERILRERVAEELELTQEARERREERIEALHDEVRRGNVVDLDAIDPLELPADLKARLEEGDELDLTRGFILGGPDRDEPDR